MRIESFKYNGDTTNYKNIVWQKYFQEAEIGKEYKCLVRSDGFLTMSDTPYEYKTNLPFLQEVVKRGPEAEVLLYGYGIGFVHKFLKPFCKRIVVIELAPQILEIQEVDDYVEVILGDAFETDVEGEFDVIFSDTDKKTGFNPNHKLKEGGVRLQWNHK